MAVHVPCCLGSSSRSWPTTKWIQSNYTAESHTIIHTLLKKIKQILKTLLVFEQLLQQFQKTFSHFDPIFASWSNLPTLLKWKTLSTVVCPSTSVTNWNVHVPYFSWLPPFESLACSYSAKILEWPALWSTVRCTNESTILLEYCWYGMFRQFLCFCQWAYTKFTGRTSFWEDSLIVRKWTRNLRAKIRKHVPKRNREMKWEMNAAFQKHHSD